ncbi:MAG: ribonuclease, partial [bacterium]|nr:ribonuclease [bacterium]
MKTDLPTQRARAALAAAFMILLLAASPLEAQPPAGYYNTVDATSSAALRSTLHDVIDDHTRFPYSDDMTTDTWDIVNLADEDPNNSGNIVDLYKNASYAKIAGGSGAYNREHSWPKSYGFPLEDVDNYP